MHNVILPLLLDVLTELTMIRIALTNGLDKDVIAKDTVKILYDKSYLSDIITNISIKEV